MLNNAHSTGRPSNIIAAAVLFAATGLLIAVTFILSWQTRNSVIEIHAKITKYADLVINLSDLQRYILDERRSQLHYFISGDAESLSLYRQAITNRKEVLSDLQSEIDADPLVISAIEALLPIIDQREAILSAFIASHSSGTSKTTDRITSREGDLGNRSREILLNLRKRIDNELAVLKQSRREEQDRTALLIPLSTFASLFTAFLGFAFLVRCLRETPQSVTPAGSKDKTKILGRDPGRFLSILNHEIRTPLNAILGFSELLENEVDSPRARRYLQAISSSGATLVALSNDILELCSIDGGIVAFTPAPVTIRKFSQEIHDLFVEQAKNATLQFVCVVEESCPDVLVFDSIRVRQILINLITNAIKFTEQGSVHLQILAEQPNMKFCEVTFVVSDTGRGIDIDSPSTLFEPFQRGSVDDVHRGGSGLGLSISRELAALMGGEVTVSSVPGAGTEFELRLHHVETVNWDPAITPLPCKEPQFDDLRPCKILVADDNAENIDLIATHFEHSHHQLIFATNGKEALDAMLREAPDLVLLDIFMPKMSGEEARSMMREDARIAHIPVIAVTASNLICEEVNLSQPFDGLLMKPFSKTGLFSCIEEVLMRGDKTYPSSDLDRKNISEDGKNEVERLLPINAFQDRIVPSNPLPNRYLLNKELRQVYNERWNMLQSAMVLSDVFSVADELNDLGERYHEPELSQYARNLKDAGEQFNQRNLNKLLREFTDLMEKMCVGSTS